MKWLVLAASLLFLSTVAHANPPGADESVEVLVRNYIHLPCEALVYSYRWMRRDLIQITNAYQMCLSKQDTSTDPNVINDPWFGLQCVYINHHWQFRYDHIMSVEKAWQLMCNDNGRKERQYEIDFPPKA
jgi:hypothetical protein